MAAVPITIVGLATSDDGSSKNVTIVGMASITGLEVGGGPIVPKPPVGIWPNPPEGQAPHPSHPIAKPGDPWWGQDLHPEHPIVIPPPTEPPTGGTPDDDGFLKAPPPGGGWSYHKDYGAGYYPKAGQPGPK